MPDTPVVSSCANPKCSSQFRRLGEGKLAVFAIDDPVAWGLPEQTKQKAVWLCNACAAEMYIRLDRRHHTVQLVHKNRRHSSHAA